MPKRHRYAPSERLPARLEHTAAHRADTLEGYLAEIPLWWRPRQAKATPKALMIKVEPLKVGC